MGANDILSQSIKGRSETELATIYTTIQKKLVKCGLKPQLHHLDNEYPKSLKIFITEVDERFQLIPPHIFQVNVAKRLVHMWKNHFMAGVCSIHPDLPIHLWFCLIQHSDITFNMLRAFIMNPKLLAYEWQGRGFISTYIPWCLLVEKWSSMKNHSNVNPGHHMESSPGTLAQNLNIIGDTGCISQKQVVSTSPTQWSSPAPFLKHLLNHPLIKPSESPKNWPSPYKTLIHRRPLKNCPTLIWRPCHNQHQFIGMQLCHQNQPPTIWPRLPLPSVPARVIPCTTRTPPPSVGTVPRDSVIIPPDNEPTVPVFITQEEEETDTKPPPRLYPTCDRTFPQNFKALSVNSILNS